MPTLERHEDFTRETVHVLSDIAPGLSAMLGEQGLRRFIELGMSRARRHGLTEHGPARLYLKLMMMFGTEFDTDPLLPWAGQTLAATSILDEQARAQLLSSRCTEYLEQLRGPGGWRIRGALLRASGVRFEDLCRCAAHPERDLLALWRCLSPERCELAGEQGLERVLQRGLALAARYLPGSAGGAALVPCFLFGLGHGAAEDPRLPWLRRALENDTFPPDQRVAALWSGVKRFLHLQLHSLTERLSLPSS
jgi:hypothetical protein